MNKTPEIRFKGFTDAWEQREFKNTFDFLQNNALSRAELSNEQGSAMNVHYGDILVKFGEVLDVSSESLPYIMDESTVKKYSSSKLQNGDIIIADAAEDETVGKCTEIANLQEETVLTGLHTIPVRTKEKFSCGYLGYYMNSNSYHNQLLPLMQGTKVSSISKSAIQDTSILYPKSAEEQQKIGDYFRNLDTLITLHQRKYEKLKQFKESMLDKMFPKEGKAVPEIRFKGFTDDWEQRKLGECCDLLTGNPFESDQFSESGILLIRGMNVKRNYLDTSKENCKYWHTSKGLEKYMLDENDILIQMDGALIGKSYAKMPKESLPAILVQRVTRARATDRRFDIDYLYQCIQRDFLNYIKGIKTETAVPHLSLNDIKAFTIFVPNIDEQNAIGSYFKNLDTLITLHQRKYEKLKQLKESMLDKMFV